MHVKRKLLGAASITLLVAGPIAAAVPAFAGTVSITASTDVSNRPDGGHGAGTYWADDSFVRTLTITTDSTVGDCPGIAATYTCYKASIADSGSFKTIPNRGAPNPNYPQVGTDATIAFPAVTGSLSGTADFVFSADQAPSAANVPASEDDQGKLPADSTSTWYELAFPSGTHFHGPGIGDYSWTYKTGCESWTDSSTNGDGDQNGDGNITGKTCATPPPPPSTSVYGDEVNSFGNGFDVFRQHFAVNAVIAGWTATQADPATHFIRVSEGTGTWRFEAARSSGSGTGLCVSDPGFDAAGTGLQDGLVLRGCNLGAWQKWTAEADGTLKNVATGLVVSPNGTGAQLRGTATAVSWGGSKYSWTDFSKLPA